MPQIERSEVDHLIREGYKFELGDYISDGFNMFKKEWLMYSLYGFVAVVILALSLMTVVGFIFLFYPVMLGFAVASDKVAEGGKLEFSDFFGAFRNFGSHALVTLLIFAPYIIIFIPLLFITGFGLFPHHFPTVMGIASLIGMMLFMFFGILIIYLLIIGIFFAPYLIHYGNYSGTEAIRTSFRLAFKNFWWLLLFAFITGLIGSIGEYLCLIGVFASIPVSILINYAMIKKTLMSSDYSEIEDIGKPDA